MEKTGRKENEHDRRNAQSVPTKKWYVENVLPRQKSKNSTYVKHSSRQVAKIPSKP